MRKSPDCPVFVGAGILLPRADVEADDCHPSVCVVVRRCVAFAARVRVVGQDSAVRLVRGLGRVHLSDAGRQRSGPRHCAIPLGFASRTPWSRMRSTSRRCFGQRGWRCSILILTTSGYGRLRVSPAALGISTIVLRERRSRPYLAVGWLWYLGTLVPVIGLVQVGAQARADRYMYLPMVGLSIMLAWGLTEVLKNRIAISGAIVGVPGMCGALRSTDPILAE